jgi:hypothetical protein
MIHTIGNHIWKNKVSNEAIQSLAFCIWQDRKRKGEPDADNEKKNWAIAKECLCPELLTDEEWRCL